MSAPRRRSRLFTTSAFGALALAAFWAAPAQAQLVQGATPAQSNGAGPTVDQSVPNTTTVTLGGSRTVIDWDKFDINNGDTANFVFANRSDIVLNRVGGTGSTINGNLNGTIGSTGGPTGGNIWIYNANGVVIGANARVSTGGLLVTTAAVDRATDSSAGGFLDGSSTSFGFTGAGTGNITVQNGAQITSHGGAIALVAPVVTTEAGSSISAQDGGNVLVGSASKYQISFRPTSTDDMDLLSFEVADGAGTSGTDAINLAGDISGNRVFVAAVSKSGLVASIMNTGTISATTVGTDETGAIVLSANHDIVNGAAAAAPLANVGAGYVTTYGGSVAGPKVDFAASENVLLRGDVGEAGATVNLHSDNTDIKQYAGVITADTLTASAHTGINFNSFSANKVDKLGALTTDTGDLAYIGDEDGVILTGVISAPGKVTLGARGFMDTTTGSITAGSLELSLGGGGSFKVNGDANIGYGQSQGAVTIEASGSISLTDEFAMLLGDRLTLVAADKISETTGFVSGGGAVTATAVNAIDLGQANQVSSFTAASNGGNISLRAAGSFSVTAGGTTGTLSAISDAGGITGTGVNLGRLTASAGGGDVDFSANTNAIRALGDVTAWGYVFLHTTTGLAVDGYVHGATVELRANGGDFTQAAGSLISGHALTITASGSILQDSGAVMHGTGFVSSTIQAGDDLILAGSNQLADYADVTLGWGNGSDVTYHSAYSIFFQTTGTAIGALNLIVDNGSISQGSAFTANSFSASASGNIDIGAAADNTIAHLGNVSSSAGEVRLRVGTNNPLSIDGTLSSTSRVILTSRGVLSGSGSISAPHLYLDAQSGGTIKVDGSTILDSLGVGGDTTVHADSGLVVGPVAGNGKAITLISDTGDIVGGSAMTGVATLTVTTGGNIDLQNPYNDVTNFVGTSTGGGDIAFTAFNPNFAVDTSGDVLIHASYGATATSALHAGTLDVTVDSGDISINTTGDSVGSYVNLLASNGSVSVTNSGTINLAGDVSALNSGTVSLISTGGAIVQASGTITSNSIGLNANTTISQGTGATLHGANLSLASGGNVTLGEANDFSWLFDLAVSGDLTLRNLGSINLDPSHSGGYSSGGQLNLTSDTGDISAGNVVTTSKLTASAVNGSILLGGGGHQIDSLGTLTAGGDIEIGTSSTGFSLTGNITATNLTLLAQNGGIIQNTGTTITADHLTATANGGISIDQLNAVGTVDGLNANLFTTGHNIAFRNAGDITLGGPIDARGGTLRLTSNTGGITQNNGAGIYVLADQLFLSGVGDVLLNSTSNNIATLIGASSTNGGILYRDANGFDIAGNITATTAGTGGVSLRTAGAGSITQSDGIIDVDYLGAITVGGGSVTLNQANRIHKLIATSGNGTLSLTTTTDLLIDQPVYFATVSLNSGGAITESINGSFSAGTANLSAVTGINLPGGSPSGNNSIQNFGTITNTTSGGINIVNYSGLGTSLTGFITAAGQTVSISDIAGGINQTGGGIAADTLNLSATGGISATRNNVVANLGTLSAGGAIAFTNVGSFNISQSTDATGNSLTLSSIGGAITQGAGTTLTADTIALAAGTTISQGAGATLHATNLSLDVDGNVKLDQANDFTTITGLAVGGDLTLRNYGNIDLSPGFSSFGYGSGGALTLISDTGNINSTNNGPLTSRLTASAAGSISLAGTIASLGTITAGQSILLTTYNGNMVLTGNVTGRNISLYGNTGLSQTGGIIDADRLNVITNGNISLTGANQIDVVGRLDTDQYDSGTGHDITLRNVGAIVLDYQIEAPDGTVTLTSDTGGISQTIFSSLFTAGTLNASAAGDIVLDYAGNNVGRVTGLQSSSGNITFNEADGFDIYGDITTPGSVSLSSGGAIETYTGHLSADTLSVLAGDAVSLSAIGNIKLGAVDTSGAGLTSGGNFYLGTDGDIALTGAVTTGSHDLILETTGGAITTNGGTVSVNYNGVGGVTYATAKGGIDLVSAGNAVIWATSTNGGDINLTGDNDVYFMVNTGGDLTVNAGGSAGNNSDVIARSVGITAGTGISLYDQTVTINVGSYRYLTVADGFIDIENQRDINLDGNVTAAGGNSGNSIRLNSSQGSLLQNSGTISGYGVELDAAQSVTQDASAKVVAGDNGLSFRATDVSLLGANEIPSINTYAVTHDLTLRVVGNLDMSGYANQAGSNHYTTLISDTGNIIGGPINADRLSATATNGKLVFTYGNNHIGSLGDLTAKNTGGTDIDIFSDSLLGLTGDISGGGVNIYATQGINQTGGAITADRLYTGTGGDLLLGGANNFGQLLDFGHGNGKNVTIRNLGSITLPGTANSVGTLTLTSDTGSIGQTSAITVTSLIAHAATGINLTQANNFTTLSGLTTGTGDIRIADTGGFAIEGDITAPGTVALASTGNITTGTTTVGTVTTPHGKVDADTLTVSAVNATVYAAGDINLGASSVSSGFTLVADGSIDLNATSTFNAASLIANAGSITQSAGILSGNTVLTGASGSITLDKDNSLSSFGGTSQGGGTVTFNNVGTSTLDLTVSTTGNAVVTTAGGVLGAYIRAGDLSLTAGGAIDLTFNTDVNSVSKLVTTSGNVLLTDANSFQITGDITAGTSTLGTVDLRANTGGISQFGGTITGDDVHLTGIGNLSQVGAARIVANTLALSGYAIIFNGANSFNSTGSSVSVATTGGLILRNAGSIDLDALGGFTSGGNLALTSDNGSITSTGAITANALSAIAEHGTVSFGNAANSFTYLGVVSASGDATFTTNSTSLSLLNNIAVGGSLTLGAQGAITQSSGTITAGSLYASTNGASGAITLAGANDIDTLGSLTAIGDVRFNDIDGFQVAGAVSGDEVWFSAAAGAIGQGSASTITAGRFIATAVDGLDFGQTNAIGTVGLLVNSGTGGINFKSSGTVYYLTGDINAVGQTVTLASANGQIIRNNGAINAGLLNIDSDGLVSVQGGTIGAIGTVSSNHYVLIGGMTGDVALTGDIHTDGFTLTTGGKITQTGGTITTNALSLSAGGDIAALADNHVGQVRLITSGTGAAQFKTLGDLEINHGTNVAGLLDVRAGGKITVDQFSTVTASQLALHAGDDIAIDPMADLHIGTVKGLISDTGDIDFYNYAGFTLDGNVSAAGTVTVRTGNGNIDQQSGVITAARLNIRTDNGNIALGGANAVDLLGDVYAGFGDFTFTNAGDLVADGSIHAPGLVTLNSGGTLRTTANGEIIGGGLIANAETGIALGRQLFGTVYGLSSTTGGIVFSNNGAFDIRGDIDAGTADVSLTANNGGITGQSAGTITAHTLTLNTDGDTALTQANHVQSMGTVDTGTGYFHFGNAGDIVVNGAWTTGGDIQLTSGGAISQTARIDATLLTASAVNGITLADPTNAIDAIGGLSNSGSGGIAFATTRDLSLNGNVAAAGQNISLTSTRSITQNGGGITATNFRATANLGLSLTSATNNVANITGLTSSVSGGIAYTDADSFNITGDINALNGQTLSLATMSASGSVNQTGGIVTSGQLNLSGGQAYGLRGSGGLYNHITGIGDISAVAQIYTQDSLNLTGTISSGYLELWSQGAITQSAGQILYTAGNFLDIRGTSIALTSATNQLGDVDALIAFNGGAITVVSDGDTRFNSLEGGNVSLTVTNGSIGNTGDNADIGTLTASASGGIDLGGTIGTLGDITAAGNALFRTGGDLDLIGTITVSGARLALASGGAITQSGGTITASELSASAATGVTLDRANTVLYLDGLSSTSGGIRYNGASGFLISGDIDSGTGDTVLSSGGSIVQFVGTSIIANKLSASAANAIDLSSFNNHIATFGALTATNAITVYNNEAVVLTDDVSGATVTLLSLTRAVRQDAGTITASSLDVSAATGIDLNAANNLGSILALSSTTGDIRLRNVGDIVLPIVSVGGNLTLTSDTGAISQGASTAVAVNGTATLNAVTGIDLSELNAINNLGQITNSGSGGITVVNLYDLFLTGNIQALGQQVSLTSTTGKVMQPSGTLTAGNLIVHASDTIALDEANHIDTSIGTELTSTSGDISFHAANDILLGSVSTQGALILNSDNGGITQSTAIAAGALSASALHGDIVLDESNAIGTVNTITADGSFTLNTSGNLNLEGVISAPTLVKLSAGGDITQVAATGVIETSQLQATSGVTAANGISLLGHNDVAQAALNSNGKDLRFRNTGDFALGNISAAGHIVEMISDGGAVTQLAGTTITAGTFSATGTNVDLSNTGNQIARIGLISTGSDLTLKNGQALTIDAIDAGSHNVTINTAGDISGGNITAGLLTLNPIGGGSVFLNTANHVASIGSFNGYQFEFVNDGSFTIAGAIQNGMYNTYLTSQTGSISMAGGAVNSGGVTLQAATGISITGNLSYVYGATATTGDVSILSSLLDIQGDIRGDTVTLGGNGSGGFVRQTSGSITANLLNGSSFGDFDLNGASNHIAGLGAFMTGGHINIASLDAVDLTGNIDTGDIFTLNAGGAVTQSGGRIQSGWLNVTAAGNITLDATNLVSSSTGVALSGNDIVFKNSGTFSLDDVTATGTVELASLNGAIWQNGGTKIVADTLTASAHDSLSFNQANEVAYLGALSAGTELTYNGATAYELTDDITAGTTVTLNGTSGISQTGGTISGQMLSVAAGSVDLQQANSVDQLGTVTTSGDFLFRNLGDIELWGNLTSNVGGKFGLYSDTGSISNPGGLFTANIIDFVAANGINLNGGTFNYIDNLTAQNGDITLVTASNIVGANLISASGTVDLDVGRITAGSVKANLLRVSTYGDVEMTGDNVIAHLGNIYGDNISLGVGVTSITGSITGVNSVAFVRSGLASDFALTMAGGAITTQMISLSNTGSAGTAVLNNIHASGALELNFNFNGNADINAPLSAISLNNATLDGDLALHASSGITTTGAATAISGTLSAQTNTGNIDLILNGTVGHFGDMTANSGTIRLGAASVDLTGAITPGAQPLELVASNGSVTQSANSVITADRITGSATNGDFLLTGANHISTLGAITVTGGDFAVATDRSLTIDADVTTDRANTISLISTLAMGPAIQNSGTGVLHTGTLNIQAIGDVVLTNQDILHLGLIDPTLFSFSQAADFDVTADIVADVVQLTSTGGHIAQSGGVITAGSATLSAQTGISLMGNNHFGTLSLSTMAGDIDIHNVGDLVLTSLASPGNANVTVSGGGSLTIGSPTVTAGGDLSLDADGFVSVTGAIDADGDVSVTSHNSVVNLFTVRAGDDISVSAANAVTIAGASIGTSGNDGEADGHNMLFEGDSVALGAASPAGISTDNALRFNGWTGSATINAGTGGATVNLYSMDNALSILATGAVQAEVDTGDLTLGNVSGTNVSLRSVLGSVNATGVNVTGDYTLWSGTGFNAAALSPCSCGIANLTITQDSGNLFLPGSIGVTGNILITVSNGAFDADTGVQLGANGNVEIHASDIGIGGLSGNNVTLIASAGTVDVRDFLFVANDYTLTGRSFAGATLAPAYTRAGTWTLTATGALDMGGNTLEYDGDIDFSVNGLLSNGTIHSLSGAVTGTANSANVYELLAATDLDVSTTAGAFTIFHAAADTGSATLRSSQALSVTGSIEAGTNVGVSAQFGAASVGYASAGGAISVYSLFGNATLRQATLTGTTGDVTVQSILGTATLGADDLMSIASDNYFERAAGSTGQAYVLGSVGARANLDHSADMALLQANSATVNVLDGDLTIDLIQAYTGTASAYLGNGSLTVNAASGSTVDLAAWGGNLTLGGGGLNVGNLYLNSNGTIDTTALASLFASNYLYIEGGAVRAASLGSGGNAEVYGDTGAVTIDGISASGDLTVGASGNLAINQVSATGYADLETNGAATIRGLTASNGFTILAQNDIVLGANAGATATGANTVETNGTLGAGCGCTGGRLVSAGGDIAINLFSVTGVLDRVSADTGDVGIAVGSGDLGINTLRGHNIAVTAPGLLTLTNAASSGGSYALTAADFDGLALAPTLFGGATTLGDVTIIDTSGDLGASGTLRSSGDIHVEAQGGAITGALTLDAQRDVTAIGQGVRLGDVTGRDVTIDAGTGTVQMTGTLNVARDYALTGGDFSGSTLWPSGGVGGSLTITDTVGDFAFGGNDFAAGGAISISAANGLLSVGNLQAGDAITLNAGTDLSLASAKLTGTSSNSLSLTAGRDLQFGAADAASIASNNVFSHASPTLTGTSIHADGNLAMNLYQADGLGDLHGGTVQIAIASGDFWAGNIDAVGALMVQGPAGTLTLGNLTTSAGHIVINGQGNTSLGNVFGHFVINLGASAGNLSVGTVAGGDVSFLVAGGIDAASVSASTLGVVAVNGDVDLDHGGAGSNVVSLGDVTVNNGGFKLRNLADLSLDGIVDVNGTIDLNLDGALTQNAGYIVADRLQGNLTGAATLRGDNRIDALGGFSSNGLNLNNISALTIDGTVDAGSGGAVIASHGGMTIAANGSIATTATGDALTLASDGRFTNLAGAGALSTPNGRWLVYTQTGGNPGHSDPNNDFGGLAGISYYGDAYNFGPGGFASAPNAGNRFVYGYRPVLTVTPSNLHLVYDGTVPNVTTTVTGLVNGDSAANAYSGAAAISGVGSNAGTYFAYSALGTLASEMGYTFAFVPGTVIIDPRVISVVLNANDRTYDGTMAATGTLTLNGVLAGDTVTANAATMAFDSKNAGTRTVTAGGITLSGASAGNYSVSATTTDLAEIAAKAIAATLTADGRTYDGTTGATGTLALNGVIGNDQVSVGSTGIAFDSKNAGIRTATASGISLSGSDAGNYVVNTSATALAEILAKAITATLTANGRTYDGSAAATGALSLAGVIGNDQVSAAGSYAFADKNAGTGKTVTASGIALSGADAGNYSVNASATALADIIAKAITVTLAANGRTYDGTNVATGTLSANGVLAGDAVGASATSILFDSANAGSRTATASGIALTGADAGNYTANGSATALATILAKAITATLTANGRVYDGTTSATGTLALNGVLSGDQVSVSKTGIAFDSKNAGSRTATASGLTLGGANAANYTITGTATGTATISPRAITATATADSRVYDGTTATTGRIALSGVISGDTVTGSATYRFADANAGTGRTVQVNGLSLGGADAANYTVSLSGAAVTADITRRSITVTAKDATKLVGQPDPVFGYSVTTGSLVNGDNFTGALARDAGDQIGKYAIGQGTLALSANYLLTVVPGTLVISFTQSGADASDALKMLRRGLGIGFSVNQDPSRNLEGDGGQEADTGTAK